jgi:spore maturation protein CgeB
MRDDFDLVVIGSPRKDTLAVLNDILGWNINVPFIFLDGEDDSFIRPIYLNRKITLYFKREYKRVMVNIKYVNKAERLMQQLVQSYFGKDLTFSIRTHLLGRFSSLLLVKPKENRIKPLPFGIIEEAKPIVKPKVYDVAFIATLNSKIRREVYNVLRHMKSHNIFTSAGGIRREAYLNLYSSSKIGVSARGVGFDTYRYWEIPFCGALLLSEQPDIVIPDNFVDGESAFFFKSAKELPIIIEALLSYEERQRETARRGHELLLRKHTSVARVEYIMKCLRETGYNLPF